MLCTVAAASPSMVHQMLRPSRQGLLYALANSAFAFYLFSFQVCSSPMVCPSHRQTIMLLNIHTILHRSRASQKFRVSVALSVKATSLVCSPNGSKVLSSSKPGARPAPLPNTKQCWAGGARDSSSWWRLPAE